MTRNRCTLRTFSLGLRDWLREKRQTTVAEEVADVVKSSNGLQRPAIVVTVIAVSLLVIVLGLRLLDTSGALGHVSSTGFLWLTAVVTLGALVYAFKCLFSFLLNSLQFAQSMCERGHELLEGTRTPA
jgi:hypothetical protein